MHHAFADVGIAKVPHFVGVHGVAPYGPIIVRVAAEVFGEIGFRHTGWYVLNVPVGCLGRPFLANFA